MRRKNEQNFILLRNFINEYFFKNHVSPSTREIEAGTGINRITAQRYLAAMRERGEIEYGERRGIETDFSKKISDNASVIQYDSGVSCGAPKEVFDAAQEVVSLPRSWIGPGDFFILTADGDSMTDIGIDSGDMVIVRRQTHAADGELAVVLVNGKETLLKRIYHDRESGGFILHAENSTYTGEALDRHVKNAAVQGIAVKVIKDLR